MTREEAIAALVKAAEDFVDKVESGTAHSRKSYPAFKAALEAFRAAKKEPFRFAYNGPVHPRYDELSAGGTGSS